MNQVLIIGGSDAGISAALRIRELAPETKVTILLADDYPNFSICGLPFYLSGEVDDWHNLAHRTKDDIAGEGINVLAKHKAISINPDKKLVTTVGLNNKTIEFAYDKLIIGTGAVSSRPPIDGLNHPGVFFLRWMEDSFKLKQCLDEQNPRSAIIIGGGYIGLEMADALTLRRIQTTLVEYFPTVLNTVHESFGKLVETELKNHGVKVYSGISVGKIQQFGDKLSVTGSAGFSENSELVLVAAGARPETELAKSAGVILNQQGAIKVNRLMETNIPNIYAAGDCVETWHQLLQKPVYMPLGTTAHKQGRIAGENAVGGNRQFEGSLGTQVVKVFNLAISRTGLRQEEALQAGYEPLTVGFETWDHKIYYPGAHPIKIRITGDVNSKQILGAQIIGHYQGEVAKRIDIFASAIFHRMTVEHLNDLDLSYTPPLSSPWDPVQMAAQAWSKQLRNG